MSMHLRLELAVVSDTDDKDRRLGRVKVQYSDDLVSDWLDVASPFAGESYGMFGMPQKGASALVAIATDDRTRAYVVGFLWNGQAPPVVTQEEMQNPILRMQAGGGSKLTISGPEKKGKIEMIDSGQNMVLIDTAANKISLESKGDLSITASGTLTIKANKVEINGDEIDLIANAET